MPPFLVLLETFLSSVKTHRPAGLSRFTSCIMSVYLFHIKCVSSDFNNAVRFKMHRTKWTSIKDLKLTSSPLFQLSSLVHLYLITIYIVDRCVYFLSLMAKKCHFLTCYCIFFFLDRSGRWIDISCCLTLTSSGQMAYYCLSPLRQ